MRIFLRFCDLVIVNQNERTHALQVENRAHILPYSQKQRENAQLNDAGIRSRVPVYALLTASQSLVSAG